MFDSPNFYEFFPVRRLFKPAKPIRHQQTCPECGGKLVNTYLRDGVRKCRRCWEDSK